MRGRGLVVAAIILDESVYIDTLPQSSFCAEVAMLDSVTVNGSDNARKDGRTRRSNATVRCAPIRSRPGKKRFQLERERMGRGFPGRHEPWIPRDAGR